MVKVREEQHLLADGSVDLNTWVKRFENRRSGKDLELINQSLSLLTNSKYLTVGIITSDILEDLGMDMPSIVSGLLYAAYFADDIDLDTDKIPSEVLKLLIGVQEMDSVHQRNPLSLVNDQEKTRENLYNFRKMLLAVVSDVRVVLIQLANHLCKMRMAVNAEEEIKTKLALEAVEIYAPLANRLGVGQVKWELEDFAFRFSNSDVYKNIAKLLDERRVDRDKYIKQITKELSSTLDNQNIVADIFGRSKHIYSIYRKMQRKAVSYGEIYDVRAVRIIVSTVTDCYAVLGIVHSLWQHIPKEFDDYIANPKDNGYKSLHTAVIGPDGKVLEVQIRTQDMHEQSEIGVAAHWRYKEGSQHEPYYEKQLNELRNVLNWQENSSADSGSEVSIEDIRADFFADRVYVFTPNGDVVDLPVGATPIDYAYHIHSSVGDRCRGAKINGKMTQLNHSLTSGDQVEILTAKEGGPSLDWLNPHLKYVVTSKARSKISQWFKQLDRDQNINDGRNLLLRELKRLGFANISIKEIAKHVANCHSEDDLLAGLANGDVKMSQAVGALHRLKHSEQNLAPARHQHAVSEKKRASEIVIGGADNLVTHMARCCRPIPGDEIIGYVTLGEGIAIHRQDCINILNIREEKRSRLIEVSWGRKTLNKYALDIMIEAYDRRGLLRDVSAVVALESVDVIDVITHTDKSTNKCKINLRIEVPGLEELGRLMSKIQQIPNVIDVHRINK